MPAPKIPSAWGRVILRCYPGELAAIRPNEVAAATGALNFDAVESAGAEHQLELPTAVVEGRAVADPLVAQLADGALDQRPGRERADHATAGRGEVEHLPGEQVRLGQIVEQADREDHLEWAAQRSGQEVVDEQLSLLVEALQARTGEVDHRRG